MTYFVSSKTNQTGNGSKESPFKTIQEAANIALPGDEVIVAPGIYREYVNPINAGTESKRITYRAEKPLESIITGAEKVTNWTQYKDDVWTASVSNSIFGNYNPYTTVIKGDWYTSLNPVHTGEIYLNGKSMYEVFSVDDVIACKEPVIQGSHEEQLINAWKNINPSAKVSSWDTDGVKYKWYTTQENDKTILYANFHGLNPNNENVEINVRRNCFYPSKEGIGFITLSGFVVKQAATTWAPPTAYQEGMVGPHWSKGWIIEDSEISDSKCSGISLGKYLQPNNENKWTTTFVKDGTQTERDAICQAQVEGWSKENIGSHIIRRCNIHDCGQTGIVGHLGGVFSIIEDNEIHHINNKQDLAGAEIGGIKMHAAIDVIIRRNHIHHCTRGLWLDWQAQGTRVSQNFFHDNVPPFGVLIKDDLQPAEDIFVEVSHGPTLIDNNILLSDCACRISTQGIALVHNLIAGSFTWVGEGTNNGGRRLPTPRFTPYHMKHRTEVAGFMTILHGDARFYNNIFVQKEIRQDLYKWTELNHLNAIQLYNLTCGTKPYDDYPTHDEYFSQFNYESSIDYFGKDIFYDHLPVYTGGNVFFNGAKPCNKEKNYEENTKDKITLKVETQNGKTYLKTNLYEVLPSIKTMMINTNTLGQAFESEQRFEAPDGSDIVFNKDFFGNDMQSTPLPGPFATKDEIVKPLC